MRNPTGSSERGSRWADSWLRFLGPWPIRPIPTAILLVAVNQYAVQRSAQAEGSPVGVEWFRALPVSVAQALVLFAVLWVVSLGQKRWDPGVLRPGIYFALLGAAAIVFSALNAVWLRPDPARALTTTLRDFMAFAIITAIFGIASDRVARQRDRAEQAVEEVERQRDRILLADEAARRDVADYLHDSVQADLVVLAMQLESLAAHMPPAYSEQVRSVIEELENVRLLDVRTASRRLSPDIATLGLAGALHEAAQGYAPTMHVSVECPDILPRPRGDEQLAAYRIVEQALLNAAVHGKASTCRVTVEAGSDGVLRVKVTNDGAPLPRDRASGAGTAVIDAWVERCDGSWSLTQEHGTVILDARLGGSH